MFNRFVKEEGDGKTVAAVAAAAAVLEKVEKEEASFVCFSY